MFQYPLSIWQIPRQMQMFQHDVSKAFMSLTNKSCTSMFPFNITFQCDRFHCKYRCFNIVFQNHSCHLRISVSPSCFTIKFHSLVPIWQVPLQILHPRNPPNPEPQIPLYKFKLYQSINLNLYRAMLRNLSISICWILGWKKFRGNCYLLIEYHDQGWVMSYMNESCHAVVVMVLLSCCFSSCPIPYAHTYTRTHIHTHTHTRIL